MTEQKVSGVTLAYLNIIVNFAVLIFFQPFIMKYLGIEKYGFYALFAAMLTYLSLFDFGLGNTAVVKLTYSLKTESQSKNEEKFTTLFVLFCSSAVIVFVLGFSIFPNLGVWFNLIAKSEELYLVERIFVLICFNIILVLPSNMYKAVLSANELFNVIQILSIFKSVITPVILIILMINQYTLLQLLIVVTSVNIFVALLHVCFVYLLCPIRLTFQRLSYKFAKECINYSKWVFLALVADQVNWNFGQFLLLQSHGSTEVAFFSVSVLFATTLILLSSTITNIMLPSIVKSVADGATGEELTDVMIKIGRVQTFIVFNVIILFALIGDEFLLIWAGKEYAACYYPALILMIGLAVPLVQNTGIAILQAYNKNKFRSLLVLLSATINIAFSFIAVKSYATVGISIIIAVNFIIFNVLVMNFYYWKLGLKVEKFISQVGRQALGILLVAIPLVLIEYSLISESGFDLFLTMVAMVTYLLALQYYFVANMIERNFLNQSLYKILNYIGVAKF